MEFYGAKDWGRLLTAMVTPFDESDQVNLAETARIADHLVSVQKNDGIVVSGTTGESPTLSPAEKIAVLKETLNAVGNKAAVVMGTGTYNTAESIELTHQAEKAGAHGIMLVNPYYNRPGQAGLIAHFSTIAKETSLPVMLYNIQPRSAINLETDSLLRLAEIKNIVAVKEASGNLNQVADVCASVPEGFRVYSGDDSLTLPILSVGGYGLVSVTAHLAGYALKEMIEGFLAGKIVDAARTSQHLLPLVRAVFSAPSPAPVKFGLSLRGFHTSRMRLPILPLDDSQHEWFASVLNLCEGNLKASGLVPTASAV